MPPPQHHPLIVNGCGFYVRASYGKTMALQQRVNTQQVLRAIGKNPARWGIPDRWQV